MGKDLDYYYYAEDDYLYLKDSLDANILRNSMASIAQNTCERYLKHVISLYCGNRKTSIMRSHSLRALSKYLSEFLPDFSADWSLIRKADGYYYNTRYPGDDSFRVDKQDILDCWDAVCETKRAVDQYLEEYPVAVRQMEFFQ